MADWRIIGGCCAQLLDRGPCFALQRIFPFIRPIASRSNCIHPPPGQCSALQSSSRFCSIIVHCARGIIGHFTI